MLDARMRSPRNTEEEEVFVEKAGAPKDHVMMTRTKAAELIKGALFFVRSEEHTSELQSH